MTFETEGVAIERANILGLETAMVDLEMAADLVEQIAGRDVGTYISFSNAFNSVMAYFLEDYREISSQAALILPDGMPVVWAAHLLGYRGCSRVSGPNLMDELLRRGPDNGLTHFFYGAGEGVPEKLAEQYSAIYPGLKIAGAYSPPFRPLTEDEDAEIVNRINSTGTDILWVGLGSPKMERFMASHVESLHCVQISVGAGLDFLSGTKPRAPMAFQKVGLEWTFRLANEPRRLWKRYASTNPIFTVLIACQLVLGLERTCALRPRLDWLGKRIFGEMESRAL